MKRLLLVEDDRSLGATLCERLQREKYEVYWAETKQRALKKLGEALWDLVILDIGLPDGSGFELARHIKEKTSLPIMFMTARSTGLKDSRLALQISFPSHSICASCCCASSTCSTGIRSSVRLVAMAASSN